MNGVDPFSAQAGDSSRLERWAFQTRRIATRYRRSECLSLVVAAIALLGGCSSDVRRFPLRQPLWQDTDLNPVSIPCRPHPEKKGVQVCHPEPYESSFAWDGADNLIFRPMSDFFAVDPAGESVNVNSLDEVPDSSWFVNRIGRQTMTVEDVVSGPCAGGAVLDTNAPDGSWLIDDGKADGANLGFRIQDPTGQRYMLKTDGDEQPERASAATSISARLYHAAGWRAPCDSVIYFRPSLLKLEPGLEITDNTGVTRPLDQKELDRMLATAPKRNGLLRMSASRWLPGKPIGPFRYEGVRDDDPNDVIPHQHRRDLRGARLIAAWVNHFDAREQNSMDLWMAQNQDDPRSSPGVVLHYYLDFGDCLGSEWAWDGISKRLGHAYYLDIPYLVEDFLTLGIIERPWDRAQRSPEGDVFGFFSATDFDPEMWREGYPNPAFRRMSERDGAWAARIIARFTPEQVGAVVDAADFTKPEHTKFIKKVLLGRQRLITHRYFAKLSPLTDLRVEGANRLCGLDLARRTQVYPNELFRYRATVYAGDRLARHSTPKVEPTADGAFCVTLPHHAKDGGDPDDAASRYAVVDIENGQSAGPARAHLYDLGPQRGYRLVGLERPDEPGGLGH
jgi:hypothetical protein